ncbi:sulfotransferase [Halodurantibacterium flavum]|uniref:Sulfotransferase n=1 Tax=Halodurantibacterium flavum TaxID=1382802 RepID=A0ABW4S4E0_9RHOB
MPSVLHICTGMPMSGSRLAFEMAVAVLESAGIPQRRLDTVGRRKEANLLAALDPKRLDPALAEAAAGAAPIAIHSHASPGETVPQEVRAGRISAQIVARDPRDVALSLLDAAQTVGGQLNPEREPLASLGEALDLVRNRMENFAAWRQAVPDLLILNYEELVADPDVSLEKIAAHLGVLVDTQPILARHGRRFATLGRGIPQRWREEMSVAEANGIHEEFAEYIERWCLPAGLPGRA